MSTEESTLVADPVADRWGPVRPAAAGVAAAALVAVQLDVAVDVLPDDAVVGIVTPVRLLVGVGLVAVALAGHRWGRWWREPLPAAASALVLAAAPATATSGQTWAGWRGVATQVALFALAYGVGGTAARVPVAAGLGLGLAGLVAVFALAAGGSAGIRADVWDATICLVDHPTNSLRVASAVRVVLGLLAARAGPGAGPAPGATVRPA